MNGERVGGGGSLNSFNEKLRARENLNRNGTYAAKKTIEGSSSYKSKQMMKNR